MHIFRNSNEPQQLQRVLSRDSRLSRCAKMGFCMMWFYNRWILGKCYGTLDGCWSTCEASGRECYAVAENSYLRSEPPLTSPSTSTALSRSTNVVVPSSRTRMTVDTRVPYHLPF